MNAAERGWELREWLFARCGSFAELEFYLNVYREWNALEIEEKISACP